MPAQGVRVPSFRAFSPASARSSRVMQANRRVGGRAEHLLRRTLWQLGYRYRTHLRNLPGCPDLVFGSARICVFCDGDFWHGRSWPKLRRKLQGRANPGYWIPKIARNRERDREQNQRLMALGWTVLRFWEGDVLRAPERIAHAVVSAIQMIETGSRGGCK